jgi:hypothetical protein
MKRHQGNMGIGIRVERADLPAVAVSRRVEGEARSPVAPPPARAPQITEKLEGLRAQIALFRARAIDLHHKLVELEGKGEQEDVRALRDAMMASVVRIESIVRALAETPDPTQPPQQRFAHGTIVKR